jgi:UDP-N-acetylglucosamine 2-epimerase (non-hydrolysing)
MGKILVVFGTRPEAIKMAPVIRLLEEKSNVKVCVTAQHRKMLDQVMDLFQIVPDYDLDIMRPGQDLFDITTSVLQEIKKVLQIERPSMILVHGDTTTSMAASMAAFYLKIPIGHVEAGLRTFNINSPFPEEFNRQLTSKLALLHFTPTKKSRQNLLNENISDKHIIVTGNTVIDALLSVLETARVSSFPEEVLSQIPFLSNSRETMPQLILVTGHRRENFGEGFESICKALNDIASINPDVQIIYPVHLNPNVLEPVNRILSNKKNIHLIYPLEYLMFIKLMDLSYLILTDSGGIQEEAPSLGKPVLVMRENTERPEAVESGNIKLVGTLKKNIVETVNQLLLNKEQYLQMSRSDNPYGNGRASEMICKELQTRGLL